MNNYFVVVLLVIISVIPVRGNTTKTQSSFFDGNSMLEENIRHASAEDLRRKLSAMNYSYMYEL